MSTLTEASLLVNLQIGVSRCTLTARSESIGIRGSVTCVHPRPQSVDIESRVYSAMSVTTTESKQTSEVAERSTHRDVLVLYYDQQRTYQNVI